MKRFFVLTALVAALFAAVDVVFGVVMDYVTDELDTSSAHEIRYLSSESNDDLLIFGSSRAANQYDAQQMTDSLSMLCYNCGESGYGVYVAYGKLAMILPHHKPRYILYEILPLFDFLVDDDEGTPAPLKPFYDSPGVDTVLGEFDQTFALKMKSGLYRHRYFFFLNIVDYVFQRPIKYRERRGWSPLEGELDTLKFARTHTVAYPHEDGYRYDERKIRYLRRFAARATAGSDVTFIVSPFWYGMDTAVLDTVKQICREYDIRLIDFSNDPRYVHHNELFYNGDHLNREGASQYTRDVIQRLREEGVFDDVAEVGDD